MPTPWTFTSAAAVGGRWKIVFTAPRGTPTDVTYFRNAPTVLESYSFSDPFSDSLATIRFPQITGFDDLQGREVGTWLHPESSVDIYWVPTVAGSSVVNPLTGKKTLALGTPVILWEGFVASMDVEQDENGSAMTVQCQGALLQLDRYLAKPGYPPRPLTYESLMRAEFSKAKRPNLRTQNLQVVFPNGWARKMGQTTDAVYSPSGAKPGENITGFFSRDTGTWDRSLTGFMQSLLAVMFTGEDCGVTPGNQWTIRKYAGRQPRLEVRDRFRAPDFEVWYGQVGVSFPRLTKDGTESTNVIYGEGTSLDGSAWRNAVISTDGSYTDYAPIAWDQTVYPSTDNEFYDSSRILSETYQRYGSGFDQTSATEAGAKLLARDLDPGWVGDMVISVDPSNILSLWQITAGMTVKVKGFAGSGATGINFHIAEVTANPEAGTVSCKIDTKYRDLLTLEEVIARTRDPLTPSKMLQVNRRTVMIEDIMAPWDYSAGSGFMPTKAGQLLRANNTSVFPWTNLTVASDTATRFPPKTHPQYYIKVKGKAAKPNGRWAFFPILTAQKGTVRRIEMQAYDRDGNPLKARFHLSLYYTKVGVTAMPMKNGQHSPFFDGAFESTQPNGNPWPAGNFFAPDPSIIIGWGNSLQPAGYSPGSFQSGNPLTGALIDEATWSFDNLNNPNFNKNAKAGQKQPKSAITIYGALYTDYPANVYFMGRFYRQEPGS